LSASSISFPSILNWPLLQGTTSLIRSGAGEEHGLR
jgi:hypothetical protein